jgi:hypothetical protein
VSQQDRYDERDLIVAFIRQKAEEFKDSDPRLGMELHCLAALIYQGRYPQAVTKMKDEHCHRCGYYGHPDHACFGPPRD